MVASILLSALVLAAAPAHANDTGIASGVYDELLIGYDPATRAVSGYYSSETGEGQFSCIFYLSGKVSGAAAPISTYYPDEPKDDLIKGKLVAETRRKLHVRLPKEHGGCWNVMHFADAEQPAEFELQSAYPWTSIAVVKSKKAYFFADPTSPTHRKAYLVKGDGVGVRGSKPGWLNVDYVDPDGKAVSGWIKQADFYPTR
jgi:hypothetical protein